MGQVDSIHQTGELALPCSSSTSSSAETIITPPTSPSPLAGESKESLPSLLHYNPQQRRAIQDHILPESIISIDIGIRNLAWVELSKEGEILRWSVVDLLAPDECNNGTEPLEELPSTAAAKESVEAKDSQSRMTLMAAEMKGTVVKKSRLRKKTTAPLVEAAPYDPHLVAVRLDKALNDILPESTSSRAPQKIVIERQRYRSGGLPEILDSTIRCAVIEGMIHCWVTAWNNRNRQRTLRPLENLNGHQGNIQMDHKDDVFIEVVPPKSVAQWWGIGQVGAIRASSLTKTAGEQDLLKKRTLPSISYQTKKKQSVALVNEWLDSESADLSTTIPSEPSRFRVWCTSAMKAWFGAEKKKDDLSDCLLQAVAWYEWRSRAIQEALDWSTAEPVEKKAKVKKVPRKSKKDDEKTRATNK
ncbi:hypothetical protein EMPS_01457 [Entomortierella parvispora]|uniref:Mitochondrial resolvase Ydc2 catalytic domain-containing protein n=1 Tax=Entomortierella parvispora TaxID=205924 RepID=A0A9P3H2V9_9FUNG|nr:hypothetical protein EMPS_01457 [Entomortierella parvispora]